MPSCFQLTRLGEKTATPLNTIDRELCDLLGKEEHPTQYVNGWFDSIGFMLATGTAMNDLRSKVIESSGRRGPTQYCANLLRCVDYIQANYTEKAWHELKQ